MDNFTTKTLTVDLAVVRPNPWNPRKQNDFMYRKLVDSIKQNGFIGAAIVREVEGGYEIINGEHRWTACKELGYKQIKVESLGTIDDGLAKLLTISLNNLEGEDDPIERGKLMLDIKTNSPSLLELLPFEMSQIESEIGLVNFDPEASYKDNTDEIHAGTTYKLFFAYENEEDMQRVKDVLTNINANPEAALLELAESYDEKTNA